jgi:hypothetical protein
MNKDLDNPNTFKFYWSANTIIYTKIIILNIYKIREYASSMVSAACIHDLVIL